MTLTPRFLEDEDRGTAGFIVRGAVPIDPPAETNPLHLDDALYIASQIEGATYGTVNLWDGRGGVGLIHQTLWSRDSQGDIVQGSGWRTLYDCMGLNSALGVLLSERGWVLRTGGVWRLSDRGYVDGETLRREVLGGPYGCGVDTPRSREYARAIASVFTPETRAAMYAAARRWLILTRAQDEAWVYASSSGPGNLEKIRRSSLNPHLGLVMVAYHALSVNPPSWAANALEVARENVTARNIGATVDTATIIRNALRDEVKLHTKWREARWPKLIGAIRGSKIWPKELVDWLDTGYKT